MMGCRVCRILGIALLFLDSLFVLAVAFSKQTGEYDMRQFYKKFKEDIKDTNKLWAVCLASATCPGCSWLRPYFDDVSEKYVGDARIDFAWVYFDLHWEREQRQEVLDAFDYQDAVPFPVLYQNGVTKTIKFTSNQTANYNKLEIQIQEWQKLQDLPPHTVEQVTNEIPSAITIDEALTPELLSNRQHDAYVSVCAFGSHQTRRFLLSADKREKCRVIVNWFSMLHRLWPSDGIIEKFVSFHKRLAADKKCLMLHHVLQEFQDHWCATLENHHFRYCATETCGQWTLFHTLTAHAFETGILKNIRDVIHHFLLCEECRVEFVTEFDKQHKKNAIPENGEDPPIWLWKRHNEVSVSKTNRPEYPNWPRKSYCLSCWTNATVTQNTNQTDYDKTEVLKYLKKAYGTKARTFKKKTVDQFSKFLDGVEKYLASSWWTWRNVLLVIVLPAVSLLIIAVGICVYFRCRWRKLEMAREEEECKHAELRLAIT